MIDRLRLKGYLQATAAHAEVHAVHVDIAWKLLEKGWILYNRLLLLLCADVTI